MYELTVSVADLHPKNNTFPGEVFMGLAVATATSVDSAGPSPENTLISSHNAQNPDYPHILTS